MKFETILATTLLAFCTAEIPIEKRGLKGGYYGGGGLKKGGYGKGIKGGYYGGGLKKGGHGKGLVGGYGKGFGKGKKKGIYGGYGRGFGPGIGGGYGGSWGYVDATDDASLEPENDDVDVALDTSADGATTAAALDDVSVPSVEKRGLKVSYRCNLTLLIT